MDRSNDKFRIYFHILVGTQMLRDAFHLVIRIGSEDRYVQRLFYAQPKHKYTQCETVYVLMSTVWHNVMFVSHTKQTDLTWLWCHMKPARLPATTLSLYFSLMFRIWPRYFSLFNRNWIFFFPSRFFFSFIVSFIALSILGAVYYCSCCCCWSTFTCIIFPSYSQSC